MLDWKDSADDKRSSLLQSSLVQNTNDIYSLVVLSHSKMKKKEMFEIFLNMVGIDM
jgi:hypothetical protein